MNTINNSSPSFGAKFIDTAKIRKLVNTEGKYAPLDVSFVEMDPYNSKDIIALENVGKYWQGAKFAVNFATTAKWINIDKVKNRKIYALTLQNDNFEKMRDEDILGLAEVEEGPKKHANLCLLQARPDIIYSYVRLYKDMGSRILDALKKKYNSIKLLALNEKSVTHFYEKNGFKEIDGEDCHYKWKKSLFARIKEALDLN